MKIFPLENFDKGYFVGDFPKAIFKTNAFEVSYKYHKKGDSHAIHYHRFTTEFILITKGVVVVNGNKIEKGNIFILEPYMINEIEYLEDVELVIVKTPSIPNDKIIVSN